MSYQELYDEEAKQWRKNMLWILLLTITAPIWIPCAIVVFIVELLLP